MAGNLVTQQRVLVGAAGGFELPSFQAQVAGNLKQLEHRYIGQQFQITKATAQIEQLAIHAGGQRVEEPKVILSAVGSIDPDRGTIKLSSAEILSSTVSLRTGGLQVVSRSSIGQPLIDTLFETVQDTSVAMI